MQPLPRDVNPFALMLDPQAVFAQIERSERLERLQRRICRPLDKPLLANAGDETGEGSDEGGDEGGGEGISEGNSEGAAASEADFFSAAECAGTTTATPCAVSGGLSAGRPSAGQRA